jgi:hypothetical protein
LIDKATARTQLQQILTELETANLDAEDSRYRTLRSVDAKVREARLILEAVGAEKLHAQLDSDPDFAANSRRVRLEALSNHCKTALKFLDTGVVAAAKQLVRGPSLVKLTSTLPGLETVIQDRWIEAQRCQHAKAYLAAVILMGSILEGLLLARANQDRPEAFRSKSAPRNKDGRNVPVEEWSLNTLIEVAVELRWLKTDRGGFSHALRESRNVVHPWVHVSRAANFDDNTCKTCWHVLQASVQDLLRSV